jgi:hypothetical protein
MIWREEGEYEWVFRRGHEMPRVRWERMIVDEKAGRVVGLVLLWNSG